MTFLRLIGAVNAVTVGSSGPSPGQVSMPNLIGVLRQGDTLQFLLAGLIKNADLHLGCMSGEDGEVGAHPVPSGAARVR